MKFILRIALLLICGPVLSQHVDFVNAPLNPIALKYKKEHFNLKGDVFGYNKLLFDEKGFLIQEREFEISKYLYKNGLPFATTLGKSFYYNSNGFVEKITFPFSGFQTETFTYDSNGLLIEIKSTYSSSNKTYDYDSNHRLIKSIENGKTKRYSYTKQGELLIITETDDSANPAKTRTLTYKNGHLIKDGAYDLQLTYDSKNNPIKKYMGSAIYYSDIKNKTNQFSVVYKKPSFSSFNKINDCKFYLNGKQIDFIYYRVVGKNDVVIYNVFDKKYVIAKDVFNDSKSGTDQQFKEVYINGTSFLEVSESSKSLIYEGAYMTQSIYLPKTVYIYTQSNFYIVYNALLNKTFYRKYDPSKQFRFYPLEILNSKDNIFYLKDSGKVMTMVEGKLIDNSEYTIAYNNNDGVLLKDSEPKYYLPEYKIAKDLTIYSGRKYNKNKDQYAVANSNQTDSSKSTSLNDGEGCISGNCIDGYGIYKFEGGGTLEGFFSSGKLHGYAMHNFPNGDSYTGNYVYGNKSGFGIYKWQASGSQYYGEWYNNTMSGYGYVVKNNETIQAGIYDNGKLTTDLLQDYKNKKVTGNNCMGDCINGYGSIKYDGGDVYTGFFQNGYRSKIGSYIWKATNNFHTGQYNTQGHRVGTGMYVDKTHVYFGEMINGELTGKGVKTTIATEQTIYGEFEKGTLVKDYKNR